MDIVMYDVPEASSSSRSHSHLRTSSTKGSKSKKANKRRHPHIEPDFPCFDMLPDELIIKVHTYLDPPTLGRTAQLCKRFNMLSHDIPLWHDLSGRGNWNQKRSAVPQQVTRSFYVQKFLSYRRQTKLREDMEQEEYRRQSRERSIEHSALAMLALLFARPYEWICTICVLLYTILVVLRLDEKIAWSWPIIFVPLLVVLYQIFFAPLVYETLRSRFDYDFEDDLAPEKTMRPIFFFLFFLMPLQNGRMVNRFLVFIPIASWTTFFVLLLLKLSDIGTHWWVVFIPLFIFGIYLIVLPLVVQEPVYRDEKWLDHVIPACLSLFFLIFFALLVMKLDGVVNWSWFSIMIPLFVLKGFLVCVPTLLSIFSNFCCEYWMEERSRWPADAGAYCIIAAAIVVLILGPLLAFEVLLAQRLEAQISVPYAIIFIPVFLLEGFGVCGCCALNIVVLFE